MSSKRLKPLSVLNPGAWDLDQLKLEFQSNKPYRHVVIPGLCLPDAALEMHEEIKKLQGTLKETDLFKVFQTGDLANADDDDDRLPYLLALKRELNTKAFRDTIEALAGCEGQLSEEIDLAANVYNQGCHLLCHDDVIGTRLISYIVYLGSPEDEPWGAEDGGRLQLYAADDKGLPLPEPSAQVPPTFNSMAFFIVEPGVSFHSVEEVFSEHKNRVSLQGWFHQAKVVPMEDKAGATLQQILNPNLLIDSTPVDISQHLVGAAAQSFLSQQDLDELSEWINPLYLSPSSVDQIRAKCASEENCVSLLQFLNPKYTKLVLDEIQQCERGGESKWRTVGPAHLRRHQELESGAPALALVSQKLASPAFTRFFQLAVGDLIPQTRSGGEVRRFRKGMDYTVAHAHSQVVVDLTLCFVTPGNEDEWASGDVGGFEVYLNKEEEQGEGDVAAAVYGGESDGVVSIDPALCTLALVFRDESRMHFVKYLSKSAPSDRYDIAFTYQVKEDEEDEEEEE